MAVLPIRHFPDPILKHAARPVGGLSPDIRCLIDDLIETMRHHPRCVGLAACQVGSPHAVAVVDVTSHPKAARSTAHGTSSPLRARSVKQANGLLVLINPEIVEQDTGIVQREGCLSVPDLTGNVRRAQRVRVQALDADGQPWERWVEGFEAVAVQHEVDHLRGQLFLDRVESLRSDVFHRKRYWFPEQ